MMCTTYITQQCLQSRSQSQHANHADEMIKARLHDTNCCCFSDEVLRAHLRPKLSPDLFARGQHIAAVPGQPLFRPPPRFRHPNRWVTRGSGDPLSY